MPDKESDAPSNLPTDQSTGDDFLDSQIFGRQSEQTTYESDNDYSEADQQEDTNEEERESVEIDDPFLQEQIFGRVREILIEEHGEEVTVETLEAFYSRMDRKQHARAICIKCGYEPPGTFDLNYETPVCPNCKRRYTLQDVYDIGFLEYWGMVFSYEFSK